MADAWQTYPLEFSGGLVTNLSPLQQGINMPGSATKLVNFEPSIEGGYRKIEGFAKFGAANAVAVDSQTSLLRGITRYDGDVIVARGTKLYKSGDGTSWTEITSPSNLLGGSNKVKFAKYDYGGTEKLILVDGSNKPFTYDGTTLQKITNASSGFNGCDNVLFFKNHIFFVNGNILLHSKFEEDPSSNPSGVFGIGNGAGTWDVGGTILDVVPFRDQLIIFTEKSIKSFTGNSVTSFGLQTISDDLGAVESDTAQEIGGDVIFLGPDGLRLLSATDRIGDFGLAVVSKPIQSELLDLTSNATSFSSIVIREKSQYRIFGFTTGFTDNAAKGILGTQFAGQGGQGMAWSQTRGINAYVSFSEYENEEEFIYFANDDGFVYRLESGNSFAGANIDAQFRSPYLPIEDPRVRKTFYKAVVYTDPVGSIDFDFSLKLDFDRTNDAIIQPEAVNLSASQSDAFFYGTGVYNTAKYAGSARDNIFETQLIGSGFTAAVDIKSDDTNPPFSLDAITLEYLSNTKR